MRQFVGAYDKWPDFVEVYEDTDKPGKQEVIFVVLRRNSRPLHHEQVKLLQLMEDQGLQVRVRVGNSDLTIEQFDKQGVYGVMQRTPGKQEVFNARAELKSQMSLRESMTQDDPRLTTCNRRISHLQELLQLGEPQADAAALKKSDERLNALIPMMLADLSDDQLAVMTIDDLEKFKIPKNTPTWIALIDRRALAQKQLKEKTQNAQQSVVTDTAPLADKDGGGSEPNENVHQSRVGLTPSNVEGHLPVKPTEGSE
jgi:hypothetical protein